MVEIDRILHNECKWLTYHPYCIKHKEEFDKQFK
jgi:hypothetical protein